MIADWQLRLVSETTGSTAASQGLKKPPVSQFVPPILALIGLVAVRPRRTALIYALGMFLALDLSLGTNGIIYPWLYKYGGVFGGLRAPARASIFFLLCLGVLAARGCGAVVERTAPRFVRLQRVLNRLLTLNTWCPLRMIATNDSAALHF